MFVTLFVMSHFLIKYFVHGIAYIYVTLATFQFKVYNIIYNPTRIMNFRQQSLVQRFVDRFAVYSRSGNYFLFMLMVTTNQPTKQPISDILRRWR